MITIIPAIDLIGGNCVRLRQGDFEGQTIYSDDPVAMARSFADAGVRRLHLVDLDGARAAAPKNLGVLKAIIEATSLEVDFSGGIRSDSDVKAALDAGATFIGIGSLAVRDPEQFAEWTQRYGAGRFFVGADVHGDNIAINGWQDRSAQTLIPFLEFLVRIGIGDVFCTDIAADGMLAGPAFQLYASILERFPGLRLTASGGIRSMQDIEALEDLGCAGAIVGKALYEGLISLDALAKKLRS